MLDCNSLPTPRTRSRSKSLGMGKKVLILWEVALALDTFGGAILMGLGAIKEGRLQRRPYGNGFCGRWL
ncbi:hypothetical protein [Candidatus Chlorohelix sp.]|uniref:hypothetical protein n=1 Tax=Candidatus Chlorohelix sp. TaxID=3139201 RepID=UPI00302E575B